MCADAMPGRTAPPPTPPASGRGDKRVTLAVVVGAHGIAGEVRLKVFAEDFVSHKIFNSGALTLKSLRQGSNGAIARFAEVADRNAAEALRGTELTVPRSALPPLGEGEYYHVDLLGLPCVTADGRALGTAVLIDNFGAGDILEIERPNGSRLMVPIAQAVEIQPEQLVVDEAFAE